MFSKSDNRSLTEKHQFAVDCITAGIEYAHPRNVISRQVKVDGTVVSIAGSTYDLATYEDVYVVGGGNAAGHVAAELESHLGDRITTGLVITDDPVETAYINVVEGDHPVPSQTGVENARAIRRLAEKASSNDLVLAIIAGGGSALMSVPSVDITLDEMQETTTELLESGATIDQINAVRKHLSAIKGGQLAEAAAPATVAGLVFSDVVGDDLEAIASGPTAPDETTFQDAIHVLDLFDIDVPAAVRERLESGIRGNIQETPMAGSSIFDTVSNSVLVSGFDAVEGAAENARKEGIETLLLSSSIRGEAREAALSHVAILEEILSTSNPVTPPVVVVSGGETTVTVRGDGEGGPNQEFALSGALELPDETVLASVDTDGIDGATDAAGAIVDSKTVADNRSARDALANNDAYAFLSERDSLLRSGPTGTNVNDLRVAVVGELP